MSTLKNKTTIVIPFILITAILIGVVLALHRATTPNAGVGNGVLYVYTYPEGTEEVSTNTAGNYLVLPDLTYCFEIDGITEYENTKIKVWASYQNLDAKNDLIGEFDVGVKPSTIEFNWTIPPTLPIGTSIKFKYGTKLTGPNPSWYFAKKAVEGYPPSPPRLLLVIPEVFLGTLGAGTALFTALGFRTLLKRKK